MLQGSAANHPCALFLSFKTGGLSACSCEWPIFCEFLEEPTVKLAFQAKVIKHAEYESDNLAVYLKLIKKYKDDIQVTDTIKIYYSLISVGAWIHHNDLVRSELSNDIHSIQASFFLITSGSTKRCEDRDLIQYP